MAQVSPCDCTSANEKSSWRSFLPYKCAHNPLPLLKDHVSLWLTYLGVIFPACYRQLSTCRFKFSPWFIEHMVQWPTTKSPRTPYYIKLDLDGGPLHSFYVVAPDPSHSGWMAITEDAVPTAKLQWCKPFETNHTSPTLPEKSFPLLAWYGQLFTCQFKFTRKWKSFLPVYHMVQWTNDQFETPC